ncbi:uncharacterized protein LOC130746870 isoform X2 [Lotus japonicus]|nr:uncharacterized protein LOC130746870 isoform X2 [Lotus japonicus]XP_057455630.1 uncharacterized protein LOC130746870 isoform X2 [Lotus japonicus]
MDAIGGGHCWFSNWNPLPQPRRRRIRSHSDSSASAAGGGLRFPVQQAATAASLALTGDTIAQVTQRWRKTKKEASSGTVSQDELWSNLSDHDWLRALRMTSYGFLFYGPGSYAWYQCLDHFLGKPTVQNLMLKVLLNQVVLGPSVIAVIFAWNNLWQQKLSELPEKYRRDALPTLLYGFRFWIPVSILNFWVVPLQARVAFMSMGSIFWNFYLSSTMSK